MNNKIIEVRVPAVGESITEVTLSKWMKASGDEVQMDEVIAELESDKATFDLTAEAAGILEQAAKEGDVLAIGSLVCIIREKLKINGSAAGEFIAPPAAGIRITGSAAAPVIQSAVAAAAKTVQAASVSPVTVNLAQSSMGAPAPVRNEPEKKGENSVNAGTPKIGERREKLSALQGTMARRLISAKNETAMLTTFNEVDMSAVMQVRAKYKDQFNAKYETELGLMSFFTKAVCEALKQWPAVGARLEGEEIVYSSFADISVTVAAPKGLMVPVIRNADRLSIHEIEREIFRLAAKASDNRLSIEDLTGGTFTITNSDVFGSMLSTPIINTPQSAILGMHHIMERPVAVKDQVVIRPMMGLALSYDHRLIDGRESVSFLVKVKELIEDPLRLLIAI